MLKGVLRKGEGKPLGGHQFFDVIQRGSGGDPQSQEAAARHVLDCR